MKPLVIQQRNTLRETEAFKKYLNEVNGTPTLTVDEELEYAIRASEGDEQAREKLITGNLRFVISVAKQYQTYNVSLEDLVNEGNLGLSEAANRFDHTKGFKFISYAVWWIRRYILEYLNKNSRTIQLPTNKINDIHKVNEIINSIEQGLGRDVAVNDIVDALDGDFDTKEVAFLLKINNTKMASLDKTFDVDGLGGTLVDLIENTETDRADKEVLIGETKDFINKALEVLTPVQRAVIINLYGLNGKPQLSLKEAGALEEIDLSRERVRQIREKSIKILKQKFGFSVLRSFLN